MCSKERTIFILNSEISLTHKWKTKNQFLCSSDQHCLVIQLWNPQCGWYKCGHGDFGPGCMPLSWTHSLLEEFLLQDRVLWNWDTTGLLIELNQSIFFILFCSVFLSLCAFVCPQVILTEVYSIGFRRSFFDDDDLSSVAEGDVIYAFQAPPLYIRGGSARISGKCHWCITRTGYRTCSSMNCRHAQGVTLPSPLWQLRWAPADHRDPKCRKKWVSKMDGWILYCQCSGVAIYSSGHSRYFNQKSQAAPKSIFSIDLHTTIEACFQANSQLFWLDIGKSFHSTRKCSHPSFIQPIMIDFPALKVITEHPRSFIHKTGHHRIKCNYESVTPNFWMVVFIWRHGL